MTDRKLNMGRSYDMYWNQNWKLKKSSQTHLVCKTLAMVIFGSRRYTQGNQDWHTDNWGSKARVLSNIYRTTWGILSFNKHLTVF